MEFNAFLNLLPDGLLRPTIRRIEGLVAAKRAAARADLAVAVRTAEPRVDADFLYPAAELSREIAAVAVETATVEMGQVCWDGGH